MSQPKNADQSNGDSNSNDMARSILDQTIGDVMKNQNRKSSKPPLPHHKKKKKRNNEQAQNGNGNDDDTNHGIDEPLNGVSSKSEKHDKKHGKRNMIFRPDPFGLGDLSSTSTASESPNISPKKKGKAGNGKSSENKDSDKKEANNGKDDHPSNSSKHSKKANASSSSLTSASSSSGSSLNKPRKERVLTKEEKRERRRKLDDPNCFPKRFEVQVQARVRVGKDLASQHLTDLPEGSVVTVEEIDERRARISRPLFGWVSVTSKFGARIMLPTNSKYSKIGGKVIFQRPITGQQQNAQGVFPANAKIIDYNEQNLLYKVRYETGQSQSIDVDHPDVVFVPQHKSVKSATKLAADAPLFNPHTSCQAFFNQFFCKDYPEYQAQSSSTTRHMDISAKEMEQARASRMARQYPNQAAPGGNYPQGGQPRWDPAAGGRPPPQRQIFPGRGHPAATMMRGAPQTNGRGGYTNPHGRGGAVSRSHPAAAPGQGQFPPRPSRRSGGPPPPPPDVDPNNPRIVYDEPFLAKVKEIERRIVQHLHQRGYRESHPDYHRYLQKAKELAITKASKERHKQYQLARALVTGEKIQTKVGPLTPEQYQKYLEFKKQEQKRLNAQQHGTASPQRLTPSTSHQRGSSVKGLIVLRGLPGSGKTTLAKKLAQRSKNARICTEDRYHWSGREDGVGEYKFQPQLVFLAREWCTKEIRECIDKNVNLIILDNHNARISMYEDHIQYAVDHGYRFRIIEFVASAEMIDRYRSRSYKKFPREVYVKLLKLWENDPRTELINPTFGDSPHANAAGNPDEQSKGGKGPQTEQSDANNHPNIEQQRTRNDDDGAQGVGGGNGPVVERNNDDESPDDGQNQARYGVNNNYQQQDYSRHPLEQGLNLMHNKPDSK